MFKKSLSYYCEYYSCGFDFSVSVLPEYNVCVMSAYVCMCVCVFKCMDGCVIAGFHTGFCFWVDKNVVLG